MIWVRYGSCGEYPSSPGNSSAAYRTRYRPVLGGSKFDCFLDTCFDTLVITDIALPELCVGYSLGRFLKVENRDTGAFLGEQLCSRETKS